MTRIATALCALALVGCAGSQPPAPATAEAEPEIAEAAEDEAPEPSVKLTTEQLVEALDACDTALQAKDEDKLSACYDDGSVREAIGSQEGLVRGKEAILARSSALWKAFPDLKHTPVLTLARDNVIARIAHVDATHEGELGGLEATKKKVGMYFVEVNAFSDDGKINTAREYSDATSFLGQLGQTRAPHRSYADAPEAEAEVVIASGSEDEKENIEAARAMVKAWNEGDWKAFRGAVAKKWSLHDYTQKKDLKGNAAMRFLRSYKRPFPDGQLVERTPAWAAGDYVVLEQTMIGTNRKRAPNLGIRKATRQPISIRFVQIAKITDGKVSTLWQAGNGMQFPIQLGLTDEPKPTPRL